MHVCHALLYNFIMNEKNAKHNQRATIKHSALRYCTEAPPGSAGPPGHDVVLMPDHAGAPALAATAGGKNAGPQGGAHTVTPAHTRARPHRAAGVCRHRRHRPQWPQPW